MNCPRCNTEITEGSLVCPTCGDWCAASAQKEKVDALKSQTKGIVHKSFRSGLFQAMTILITVVAALTAFSSFTSAFDVTFVLYVIAAVFCWKAHTSTDQRLVADHMRRVSVLEAAYWIIMLVAICCLAIGIVGCIFLMGVSDAVLIEAWEEIEKAVVEEIGSAEVLDPIAEVLSMGAAAIFGILTIVLALVEAYLIWVCIVHLKRRKYLKAAAEAIELDRYDVVKAPPYNGAIIYASLGLFSALSTFLSSLTTGGISIISLANTIALNSYIITSAVWMTRLHKDELANIAELENESAILNNLIYSSKIAYEKQVKEKVKEAENEVNE